MKKPAAKHGVSADGFIGSNSHATGAAEAQRESAPGEHDTSGFDMSELATLLDALPSDGWIVERTLSASQFETTQIVRRDKGVVDNRFIRKVFPAGTGLGTAYQRVFAAQTAGMHFDHLPVIYDITETGEGVAMVSQLVQGQTLQHLVETGAGGTEFATLVGMQLCDAMSELHDRLEEPVIHRDLKPSNIMMSHGKLMLIDLGIARMWRAGETRDTIRLGTPGYAPPEQFGYGQTTAQSDIYAAGMVVAFCLTGANPGPELRESGFDDARIPSAFRTVLVKATALDASQRFPSALEMATALQRAASHCGVRPTDGNLPETLFPEESANARGPARTRMNSHNGEATDVNRWNLPPEAASGPIPARTASDPAPARTASGPIPAQAASGPAPAQDGGGDFAAETRPAAHKTIAEALRLPRIPNAIGIIWNTLLALVWVALFLLAMFTAFEGGTEFLDRLPVWFRVVEYLGFVVIPTAAAAIVLADKRRLRTRFPLLARISGLKLLGICVVAVIVALLATYLLYLFFFEPGM